MYFFILATDDFIKEYIQFISVFSQYKTNTQQYFFLREISFFISRKRKSILNFIIYSAWVNIELISSFPLH